jgi:hypothetical protein
MGAAAEPVASLAACGEISPALEQTVLPVSWAAPAPLPLHPAISPRGPPARA